MSSRPYIIAIASTKGGPGKTTITVCLADWWRRAGRKVVCLDTDPNRNLFGWIGNADLPDLSCKVIHDEEDIVDEIEEASGSADFVLVDVAGVLNRGLVYAVGAADAVIMPCRPSMGDVIETARTRKVVLNASKSLGREIVHAAVLTQVNRRAVITDHSRSELKALGISALSADVPLRTAYQRAWYDRCSPLAAQDPAIAAEIGAVAAEIESLVA